jgi:inosine/xanthosine triphosphate pyrophosphatase family protein
MTLRLIAATHNPAKLAELTHLVDGIATVEPLPQDISLASGNEATIESAPEIETVAKGKAVAWSLALEEGRLVVASDGGLLIPALGHAWQPARTRRFAGDSASDLDRADRLLQLAAHLRGDQREIGWRESVAIACHGELLGSWVAESDSGLLSETVNAEAIQRGNGFWIPAVWRCPELDYRLLGDLSSAERNNRNDHWRKLNVPIGAWLRDYDERYSRS